MSLEADRYPKDRPDLADLIDRAIGELSPFEQRFGCHAQGVGPETAVFLVLSGKSGGALRRTAHL